MTALEIKALPVLGFEEGFGNDYDVDLVSEDGEEEEEETEEEMEEGMEEEEAEEENEY